MAAAERPILNLRSYFCAAFLAVLVALGALALCGVWPFGTDYLSCQDNQSQVSTDFEYIRQILSGRSDLFWSYASGGTPHSSFHPTFNSLLSPLTWLTAFIPGISTLARLSVLFVLQAALLPLGALFYLRRTFPRLSGCGAVTLSLGYAFSAFSITKIGFLPFLNVAILFPLFLYGLDILLKRGRWVLYAALLGYLLATGTYLAYMWLLFAILYAASRAGWRWKTPVRQHSCLLLLVSLSAILLTAALWLPSFAVTASSARAGRDSLLDIISRPGLALSSLSVWLFPVCGLLAILFSAYWKKALTNRYGICLIALLLALGLFPVSNLWHVSIPAGFAGRYSYMATFMLTCLAAQAWNQPRRWTWGACLRLSPFLLMAVLGGLMSYLHLLGKGLPHAGQMLAAGEFLFIPTFLCVACVFIKRQEKAACALATLFMVFTLSCYISYVVRRGNEYVTGDASQFTRLDWVKSQLPPPPAGDVPGRIVSPGYALPLNVAYLSHLDSLSHYRATQTRDNDRTMGALGHIVCYALHTEGGTIFSDTLLGTRYYVTRGRGFDGLLKPLAHADDASLYENPWYFGMGLMLPESVRLQFDAVHPLVSQQQLLTAVLGREYAASVQEYMTPARLYAPRWSYVYSPQKLDIHPSPIVYSDRPGDNRKPPLRLLPHGQEVELSPASRGNGSTCCVFSVPERALDALKAYAEQLPVHVRYQGRHMDIEARSSAERNQLFLPLLWQDGYHACEDGQELKLQPNGGFVSILLPEPGTHRIRLTWQRPLAHFAWILSAAGALALLLLRFFHGIPLLRQGSVNTFCNHGLRLAAIGIIFGPVLLCFARLAGLFVV